MHSLFIFCIFYKPPDKVPEVTCEHPDFRYIFEVQSAQRCCFGNTRERNTNLTGKGLSPHQLRTAQDVFPNVSPNKYDLEPFSSSMWPILHKCRSVFGVPGLGYKQPRWPEKEGFKTPSPLDYAPSLLKKTYTQYRKPFGKGSPARVLKIQDYPGPGFYDLMNTYKCRKPPGQYNLGHPEILPCIEMICVKEPTHTCQFCNKLCRGDYWHINKEVFLCQVCWHIEKMTNEYLSLKDLKKYKKLRNCSFMHEHNNTTAALRIMEPNQVKKKLRLENYLDVYISCYDK